MLPYPWVSVESEIGSAVLSLYHFVLLFNRFFFLSKCVHVCICELKSIDIPFSALCLQVQYKNEARLIQ